MILKKLKKMNKISKFLFPLFFGLIIIVVSCQKNVTVIEEKDKMVKVWEEKDSLKVIRKDRKVTNK